MDLKIQKWGNSAAIRLPISLLKKHNLQYGDALTVMEIDEAFTIKLVKAKPSYTLAELLEQCDPNAPEPDDLAAWNEMGNVGREA